MSTKRIELATLSTYVAPSGSVFSKGVVYELAEAQAMEYLQKRTDMGLVVFRLVTPEQEELAAPAKVEAKKVVKVPEEVKLAAADAVAPKKQGVTVVKKTPHIEGDGDAVTI